MRSKVISVIAFSTMLFTVAGFSLSRGNIFIGILCGLLAVVVVIAADCIFTRIENEKVIKERNEKIADGIEKGLEDGSISISKDGLKVDYSFIDEEAAE